jgi:hypothetical protein
LARDLAFACTIMLCKVIQSMKERTRKKKKKETKKERKKVKTIVERD